MLNGAPPNADEMVIEMLLRPWVQTHGQLPPPCPSDFRDCATWWRTRMQEPEREGETSQAHALAGGTRWDCGYATRLRSSLLAYLGLGEMERRFVAVAVQRERVPYRGEDFALYRQTCEEVVRMRENPDSYRRGMWAKMKASTQRAKKC